MNKLWLDVTTMLSWNRPAVGIVRVETECASHALKIPNEPIYFCRYEAGIGYRQVSATDVAAALERIRGVSAQSADAVKLAAAVDKSRSIETAEQRLQKLALRLISKLPGRLRLSAFNYAKRNKAHFLRIFNRILNLPRKAKGLLHPAGKDILHSLPQREPLYTDHDSYNNALFEPGDVYISLGLDWDQKDLNYLYAHKKEIGFKVLLFCYDIIPVKFPHLCVGDVSSAFSRYFADAAWCADEFLCISRCSRNDLHSLLDELYTPIPQLSVVKLGCEFPKSVSEEHAPEVSELLGKPFLLFVSTIERRKSHETLYRAYTRLVDQGVTAALPLLVFVGMPGWGVNDLLNDIHLDPRTKDFIKILHHVSDSDLIALYEHALFTVYPSLYEGWGLPVAESLAKGKFCLASNAASIPEVGGNLIEYLDPWNVQEWADRIFFYIDNRQELSEKEEAIRSNYKPTKWQSTAGQIFSHAISLSTLKETGLGYEERLQNLYSGILQEGDCAIDIGAHTGRHCIPMACQTGAGGMVIAFEPNPDIAEVLKNRIDILALDQTNIYECALSHEKAETTFVVAVDLPEESGLKRRATYNAPTDTKEITVQVNKLDDFNIEHPKFLKIDTEGAEYDVLRGSNETLSSYHPVIAFEFGAASYSSYNVDPHDLFQYLSKLGYILFSIFGQKLDEEDFCEASVKQDYWDYVACTPDDSAKVQSILSRYEHQ